DTGTSIMGDVPRVTLKTMGDVSLTLENQTTRYPDLNANFELKSGLINQLPKFHFAILTVDSSPETGPEKRSFVADSSEPMSRELCQI
ncbi:hypothetical protein PIB30_088351, partial [Stylosanthes scabra]|nr:hypothetical protein [Stylosanthes scabra]